MKFKLKEAMVDVRGEKVRVRELTHAERLQWVREATDDRYRGPSLLVSLGALEPKLTEEEVGDLPADVVETLSQEVMRLSGMNTAKKEPDAGGVVPLPTRSGVGDGA